MNGSAIAAKLSMVVVIDSCNIRMTLFIPCQSLGTIQQLLCGLQQCWSVSSTRMHDLLQPHPPVQLNPQQPGAHVVDVQLLVRQLKVGGNKGLVTWASSVAEGGGGGVKP